MKKLLQIFCMILVLGLVQMEAQTYCSSGANDSNYFDIEAVLFDSIYYQTGCNSLTNTLGYTASGIAGRYSNWTTTNMPPYKLFFNTSNKLAISLNPCTMSYNALYSCKIFIDWNRDGDFLDSLETIYGFDSLSSAFVYYRDTVVHVPNFASAGASRMRIITSEGSVNNISPCGTYNRGETEDYKVNIGICTTPFSAMFYRTTNGTNKIFYAFPNPADSFQTYTYEWRKGTSVVGTSSSLTLGAADTGNYCLRITSSNGCTDDTCFYVPYCSQTATSTPGGVVTQTLGSTFSTTASATSGYTSVVWYRNGTPVSTSGSYYTKSAITYADTGCYYAKFTYPNGCVAISNTTCLKIQSSSGINCTTYKYFTYTKSGSVYYFSTLGNVSAPYTASYSWNFSNGQTSTQKNPIITSTSPLTWAYLTICIDSGTQRICCDTSYQSICNLSVSFGMIGHVTCAGGNNGSIQVMPNGGTSPFSFLWSNGSTNQTLSAGAGTYSVTVTDAMNCTASLQNLVLNQPSPITITIQKSGATLSAQVNGGTPSYNYLWSNGATGSTINVSSNGVYCLSVTDMQGCTAFKCDTFTAGSTTPCSSFRNFTWSNVGNNHTFYPSPQIPSYYFPSILWTVSNGATSTLAQPMFSLTPNNTYTVKYKYCLSDSNNNIICCDSIIKTVSTTGGNSGGGLPCNVKADFNWYAANGGIQFLDSTTPQTSQMYTYYWIFGDGTSSTQKNPFKAYTTNGTKTVCLLVRRWLNSNNMYCEDTICKTIQVSNVNPCNKFVPNFTWTHNGNGGYNITNTTPMSGLNYVSTSFTSSNGQSFNYNNPTLTFQYNGYYSVTMTMSIYDPSSGTTCTKTITKYIYVNNSICGNLDARSSYTKSGMTANFTNLSTGTDTTSTYLYKFGNGATSNQPSPSYTYPLPGVYRVVMIVTRQYASGTTCTDSFVQYIQITTSNPCKDSGFTTYYNQNCNTYIEPVCGCDSITYQNYCYAYYAGVKQRTLGPCPNDTTYVKICGYVYNDINKNCVKDTFEPGIPYVRIDFNSTPPRSVYTNASGFYTTYLRKGTYTITQNLSNSYSSFAFNQLCPAGAITVAATTAGQTYCNNNFFDTTSTCPDLSVVIGRSANITPGFPSYKWIRYRNNGATPISNVVLRYRFLSNLQVSTSTSATYSLSGNVLTWNLGTVPAYSTGYKYARFYTPTNLALGTTVVDSVWIEPISTDCKPSNNISTYNDTCVSSWDPNDKATAQGRYIDTSTYELDYHVRFQNTGTAPAHNVSIVDVIDPNLDLSTLKVNSSSHPMTYYLEDNRTLSFEFANIMLPDSGTDYDASQGYVDYSIMRKPNLPLGTDIKNTAAIYFDYNEPVITNTTINTLYLKSTTAVSTSIQSIGVSLYPNPVRESATIVLNNPTPIKLSMNLYDIQGKIITSVSDIKAGKNHTHEMNMNQLPKGIYILQLHINGESKDIKIFKE